MASNPYDAYLESTILSADPVELIRIAYKAALDAVGQARRCLRQGDIAGRSRTISRASAILTELMLAVDRQSGGPLGRNLVELYDYMQRRLIEANVEQADSPLAEVGRLLSTLLEGWMHCQAAASVPPAYAHSPAEPLGELVA